MQDRVPVNPGRVLITPEDGSPAYYATMTRADNPTQLGTPLNKANLLKDNTAALFGFENDAVPDEILAFLGRYNQHWWSRVGAVAAHYTLGSDGNVRLTMSGYSNTLYYADSIVVADDGTVSLVGPVSSFEVVGRDNKGTGTELANLNAIKGKFFYVDSGSTALQGIHYRTTTTDAYFDSGSYVSAQKVYGVAATSSGETSYVFSTDRNAYPDSGTVGGLQYQYVGIPFDNIKGIPNVAVGSYTGTGKSGSSNPVSLKFDFPVKFLAVGQQGVGLGLSSNSNDNYVFQYIPLMPTTFTSGWGFGRSYNAIPFGKRSADSKTISWYHANGASYMFNTASTNYWYLAIG